MQKGVGGFRMININKVRRIIEQQPDGGVVCTPGALRLI